jgi:hypothetical protein
MAIPLRASSRAIKEAMDLLVGTKVVDTEKRITQLGPESWVRGRFGDFVTPWIEAWQFERVR